MLIYLSQLLMHLDPQFDVFLSHALRIVLGVLTSLMIMLLLGPYVISYLNRIRLGQFVRSDGPQSHFVKEGTPTMGGILILISISVSTLLWADLENRFVWIALLGIWLFGLIGWRDDYAKVIKENSTGMSAKRKFQYQSIAAFIIVLLLYATNQSANDTLLIIPFIKPEIFSFDLRTWHLYPIFTYLVIVGTSNAVNLTDGLDGLAIVPVVLISGALIIFSYVTGIEFWSDRLLFPYVGGAAELSIFCATIVGAGLGFLWFNTHPAQIFMGDIGSLALGAAIGIVAVCVRQELLLIIMGGVFVTEALSVIVQVLSYKLRGKRVFRMAPIHHHFELKGEPEARIVVRFWIITVILVLIALASLKIR